MMRSGHHSPPILPFLLQKANLSQSPLTFPFRMISRPGSNGPDMVLSVEFPSEMSMWTISYLFKAIIGICVGNLCKFS